MTAHVAAQRCRIVASPDGAHAAIVEPGRIVVVELERATQIGEVGVATAFEHTDVAWIGAPPRLLVLSRRTSNSTVHLIDLDGPRARAEIQIEGTMRIAATVGAHALVIGTGSAGSTAILTAGDSHLTPYQFPGRSLPTAAGAAARQLVVAIAGAIEEWDPQQRTPRRRLRLPRQAQIAQIGGTERVVWLTTHQEPARIDVIAQVNRAQPKLHELPEPIAQVSSHPQRDLLACIGRDSGEIYLVDLDGRAPTRAIELDGLGRADAAALFVGPTTGVIAARAGQPLAVLRLDPAAASRGIGSATPPGMSSIAAIVRRTPSAGAPDRGDARATDPSADAADGIHDADGASGDPPAAPSSLYDPPLAPSVPIASPALSASPAAAPAALGRAPASPGPPVGRPGLASLQLRGLSRATDPATGPGRPAPNHRASAAAAPSPEPPPRRPARPLSNPPAIPPVIRPPIDQAIAALAPRLAPKLCSSEQYIALLEHYRRYAATTALRAIAQDWDRGRLAFSTHDRLPLEAEVFGIVGLRSGLAKPQITEASLALDDATRALHEARAQLAGRQSPLDLICAEYGIGMIGELVLLFVAAPGLWGELARLYGILSNDPGRGTCDEHLLWQLLGHVVDRRELARELDSDSPLLRHGLIRTNDRPRPFQAISADPIAIKLLSGAPVDSDAEHGIARIEASVALDQLMIPVPVIDRALADLAAAAPGRGRVVVTGRSGSGRRTLLAALAQLAGRTLATIDAAMLIRDKQIGALAGLLQHAHLRGWLPCVDGLETIASDDAATRGTVRELLRDHHGPLAVRLPRHVQPPLEPGYALIELPTSTIAERAAQWSEILTGAGLAVRDVDELAARFIVGPGTIKSVVTAVARAKPGDPSYAIEAALRQYLETKLGNVATRVTRLASWSQIVLPADIQDSIVELIARIRHRRTVYDTWGFDQVMASSRGLTALFQGGPGTGKTLVASAIASELGLDLYRIDLSRVMSKWIGETEQNLAKVFDAAEEGQALILFDEADSLFGKRTEVRTSVDRYANLETNYLLQRLDSFEGVAVLTTNFGTAIDAAFTRRLSCRLTFPFPDDEARERLWQVHLPDQLPRTGEIDLGDLARRFKMSGGYIRNAALRAAFLAAEEQAPLSQDHLERAVRAEFREGGKLAESGLLE
jgi:hypothetical protein